MALVPIPLLLGQFCPAFAANFLKINTASGPDFTAILLYGDIRSGDMNELLSVQAASITKNTLLLLESPGGDASEGLLIAKFVHNLGWDTAAIKGAKCFSACATIWIAGKERFLSSDAVVGFHDVYDNTGGPSAPGNAMVGAFYGQLGLSDRVIQYLTIAPPNGFNQITLSIASSIGLEVIDYDKLARSSEQHAPQASANTATPSSEKSAQPDPNIEEITQSPISPNAPAPSASNPTNSFTQFASIDIIGHDIPNAASSALSPEYCQQICESRQECLAFTYDMKHQMCFPKDGGKLKLFNQKAISGAKSELLSGLKMSSIALIGKSKLLGTEYRQITSSQIGDCIEQCDLDSACRGLSYNAATTTCLLFNVESISSPTVGWLAGTKH